MSKKKGEGLKSFNRGFNVPDTYIIIFFVVVIAAVMTFLVPKGYYETEDVTYLMNGVEKTRTVIKDGSFQYLTDAAGKPVTEGVGAVHPHQLHGAAGDAAACLRGERKMLFCDSFEDGPEDSGRVYAERRVRAPSEPDACTV